jgi:TrmH family RNA methyltransferase
MAPPARTPSDIHCTFPAMEKATHPNRVILVEPEIPENVGFVVRAMACFGWTDLAIVGNRPERESAAYRTATMGKEILDSCTTHPDLVSAFGQARTTVAFTRRPHQKGLVALPHLASTTAGLETPWALVFGRESIGLTSDEVMACDIACNIPTTHTTGSLNLGQAVAVALAGFHAIPERTVQDPSRGTALAALRESWVKEIMGNAESMLHPARREAGRRHLASLLRRMRPTREELRFLTSFLAKLAPQRPKR